MDRLAELRSSATPNDLKRLRVRVVTHQQVIEERALTDSNVDVEMGRRVVDGLLALIDAAESFDRDQRSWVRAAIDYFILTDDSVHDLGSTLGLHDDANAVNVVCDAVGRPDLRIVY